MKTFIIELAGIPIEVNAIYDCTENFFLKYLTDKPPLFSVTIKQEDIERIKCEFADEELALNRPHIAYSDRYLEHFALSCSVLPKLLKHNALLFHASVIVLNGKAYLFAAKSGTGKTTHCNRWERYFTDCYQFSGDKNLLLFKDNTVYVCTSPFSRQKKQSKNEIIPVEALCILERDNSNHIEKVELSEIFKNLLSQCYVPSDKNSVSSVVSLLKKLDEVGLYRLGCNLEKDAAFVSYYGMVKTIEKDDIYQQFKLKYDLDIIEKDGETLALPLCDDDSVDAELVVDKETVMILEMLKNPISEAELIDRLCNSINDREKAIFLVKKCLYKLRRFNLLSQTNI